MIIASLLFVSKLYAAQPAMPAWEQFRRETPRAGTVEGAPAQAPSVLPPGTWEKLPAPSAQALRFLSGRLPGLDTTLLKELTAETALAMLAQAEAQGASSLDLFTDEALRQDKLFYIPQDTLALLQKTYELRSLFVIEGKTTDDTPFAMQAIVMGRGAVEMLYSLDDFTFKHPIFQDYGGKYRFKERISQAIEGPGVISIKGAKGPWGATIQRFIKLSPTRVKVVTSLKDSENDLFPIKKRP